MSCDPSVDNSAEQAESVDVSRALYGTETQITRSVGSDCTDCCLKGIRIFIRSNDCFPRLAEMRWAVELRLQERKLAPRVKPSS